MTRDRDQGVSGDRDASAPGAARRARQRGAQPDAGATGCEMAVPGRNGGTLYPSEAGSNKGVHRGPDLGIRRNVMEGMLMRALIRDGLLLVVVKSRRPEFRTTAEDSRRVRPPGPS